MGPPRELGHRLDIVAEIGERDVIIAATALAHGLAVVPNNTREFAQVPGLVVEDWSLGVAVRMPVAVSAAEE